MDFVLASRGAVEFAMLGVPVVNSFVFTQSASRALRPELQVKPVFQFAIRNGVHVVRAP
jgi:hypothetical protein